MTERVVRQERWADISPCGRYRYALGRTVVPHSSGSWALHRGIVLWVMLNPSTADAHEDDPTIRKVLGFTSRAFALDSLTVVNLFALRSTDPQALLTAADPVGPENDRVIEAAARCADVVVLAWGHFGLRFPERTQRVVQLISEARTQAGWRTSDKMLVIGRGKGGFPRHPLMVGYKSGCDALLMQTQAEVWP